MNGSRSLREGASRVVGVDPGTAATGWAVLERSRRGPRVLASGVLRPRSAVRAERLREIHDGIREVVAGHRVDAMSLEKAFTGLNVQSAFRLAEARGVVLLAAAEAGIEVFEYAPATVKQTVVGHGRAGKAQMMRGVALLLGIETPRAEDEADALALAACHLQGERLERLVRRART